MCLIVFSYRQHPKYDLIFAANRDEFFRRPAREARFWPEHPHLLAGKDLEAGGTWMGITTGGHFSAITNFRDMSVHKENAPSRGHLVLDYLIQEQDPEAFLHQIDEKADLYNGFNLLMGTIDKLLYYSNQTRRIQTIRPGLYGLSNHLLNTPWPKVERARHQLQDLLDRDAVTEENLLRLLMDGRPAPDEELPDTGLPKELERAVSSIFIKSSHYGTRASTVLLIDKQGEVTFCERRHGPEIEDADSRYLFQIGTGSNLSAAPGR